MQALLIVFEAVAGLLNTLQTGANTTLNKGLGAPVWAAVAVGFATFVTTLSVALSTTFFAGQRFPVAPLANVLWYGATG